MPSQESAAAAAPHRGPAKTYDVFLSYSRRDAATVERIAVFLKREGLEPWLDRWCTTPGKSWQDAIHNGLDASLSCAVFIGGGDLGPWEREEMEHALDRAATSRAFRVFPVLLPGVDPLDPGAIPPFLRSRTWVDLRAGPQDARGLGHLVCAVRGTPFGADVPIEPRDGVAPYRGLRVFEEQHAPYFFGRDRDVQRLLERLRHGRFVAVLGASGSGKSSLTRAGLVPVLRAGRLPGSDGWGIAVVRFGAHPLESLAAAAAAIGDERGIVPALADLERGERGLHLAVEFALARRGPGDRAVVVVDQLEEAFTLCRDPGERNQAFDNLAYAASRPGGRCVVVVTMRADFYPRLAEHRPLAELVESTQELIGALGHDELRQAIEGPAHRVGLDVESGLAEKMIADAGGDPGALPLLEHALLETWRRPHAGMLTLAGYIASGGVQGALAERAEKLYGELAPEDQDVARRLLLRLTEPGDGVADTRRRAPRAELLDAGPKRPAVERVIDRFTNERLLTAGRDESGTSCVEVAHEALIRGWPRLQSWIDERRLPLIIQRRVIEAAREWDRVGRDESALYRGAHLAEAIDADARGDLDLTEREREFLAVSRQRARREQGARRRRLALAVGSLAVVLAALAAVVVMVVEQQRRERLAEASELAARSAAAVGSDPGTALRLALDSVDTWSTPEGETAIRQAAFASRGLLHLTADSSTAWSASASPDGQRVVGGGDDGVVRLWELGSGKVLRTLRARHASVFAVRFAPTGRRIAVGYADGTVLVTDASLGRPDTALRVPKKYVSDVAFDRAGTMVAAVFSDGTLRVAPLDGRGPSRRVGTEIAPATSVDVSADGGTIVTGGESDERVRVWNARTGEVRLRLPAPGLYVTARLSPDGTKIVSAGQDVRVWDATTGVRLERWTSGTRPLWGAAVSRDGQRVAVAGQDGTIRVWSWDGAPVTEWRAHRGQITDVAFASGDDRVISAGDDGTLRLWEPVPATVWDGHAAEAVEFDRRQRLVAGGNGNGTVLVWDAASHQVRRRLHGPNGYTAASFSPSGDMLLVSRLNDGVFLWPTAGGPQRRIVRVRAGEELNRARFDHTGERIVYSTKAPPSSRIPNRVVVRDLASGRELSLGGVHEDMLDVRFSPDGRYVAAAGSTGAITIWRRDRPAEPHTVLRGHEGHASTIAYSPAGDRIVSTGGDGTVRVWNLGTRRAVVLRGHAMETTSAVFTQDGSRVVSSSQDGTVRLWDARGGTASVVLEARSGQILDATLAPDGRTVATTGIDGVIRVFSCEVCGGLPDVLRLARSRERLQP